MTTTHTSQSADSLKSSSSRSGSRTQVAARNEIVAMLKNDHKRVKKAFRDFGKLDQDKDRDSSQQLVSQTCNELEVHASLEEELFYPAARNALGEEALIDEAEVEHMSLKTLIGQLKGMSPQDDKYAATFKVLGEYVSHHVVEEEQQIFPKLSHTRFDWRDLLQQMTERRAQLMGEHASQPTNKEPKTGGKDSDDARQEDRPQRKSPQPKNPKPRSNARKTKAASRSRYVPGSPPADQSAQEMEDADRAG